MTRYGSSETFTPLMGIVVVILISVVSCGRGILVSETSAIRTLETQGYSEIQIMDRATFAIGWRGCDEKDAVRFTAQAKNPAGRTVTVYVCSGLFKGGTIRTP